MKVLFAALALTACVQAGGPPPPDAAPGHGAPIPYEEPPCYGGPPQRLIGREWSEELARTAQRLARAKTVRTLRPGQVVTMEYRADRLNLHVDANNRVERIACG